MYNAKNSARIEEMLNYFSYGYINDTDDALVTKLELDACPWNNEHYLASVVVKAKPAITENVKNNIVILVDKSGSMNSVFSLVKKSLHTLVDNLGEDDVVSIVSYASTGKIECEGLTGKNKTKLNNVIDGLESRGSTYGEDGIEKAYNLAYKYFINGGNNRVVLLTDGDFNVGKVSGKDLTDLIKQKAADGVYLTCCGYRSNNNDTLYTLADNGNGNAYYIDDELEATKVFEEELGKSLYVVAKDAKCQIEFSNDVVSYRLLGYETRQMSDEEFEDDKKDAGEIMSDHTTVALYELELKTETPENFFFKTTLRYKDPTTEQNKEVINTKTDVSVSRRADFDFASYVAEYALTITESKYKGESSYTHLLERINDDYINDKYRDDFKAMVNKTKQMNSDY
jgi:Ca-activated chloride channel family protein